MIIAVVCFSFSAAIFLGPNHDPVPVLPSKQRTGDSRAGYEYLTTGDYLRSGIPPLLFQNGIREKFNELFKARGSQCRYSL